MITILVNFTLCSGLLLLTYHLMLKNKTMYNFNRFYLLASLVFSLAVPFITIQHSPVALPAIIPAEKHLAPASYTPDLQPATMPVVKTESLRAAASPVNYLPYIILCLYTVVLLVLLFRLIKNLHTIRRTALNNDQSAYHGARLVFVDEALTPHTFLKYIFLNRYDYDNHKVEVSILKHELTHARQLHSLDIVFVEVLQAVCWFNPFIFLYRRAIQLNHEFIADSAVLCEDRNVTTYQHLLLSKLACAQSLNITSQFNYSVTKKRLIMMSKNTPRATAMLARLAVIPVMAVALLSFCTRSEAKQTVIPQQQDQQAESKTSTFIPPSIINKYPCSKENAPESVMKTYADITKKYEDGVNREVKNPSQITTADKALIMKMYPQMSREQQSKQSIGVIYLPPPPPVPQVKVPTQAQLDEWAHTPDCMVRIEKSEIKNTDLQSYKPTDFKFYFVNKLSKNKSEVVLWSAGFYKKYAEESKNYTSQADLFYRFPSPHYFAAPSNIFMKFAPPRVIGFSNFPHSNIDAPETLMKEYAGISSKYVEGPNKPVRTPKLITDEDKDRMEVIFKQMSVQQQSEQAIGFYYPGPPLSPSKPTKKQLTNWLNPKLCGVWIDDKKVSNDALKNYQPADFGNVLISNLTPAAINYKYYKYQINLMTVDFYKDYRKQAIANQNKSHIYVRMLKQPSNKS
ncbi:MAG TPA: M56 family metallopeptidase [Mucilaginibacter sp.]